MKIVVSSDYHNDVVTLGVPRFPEIRAAVRQIVDFTIRQEADVFAMLGDLTDPDSGGSTFQAIGMQIEVAHELAAHDIKSIWIAGNHCVCEDGTGATVMTPLAAIEKARGCRELVYVAEDPRLIWLGEDLAMLCLPFTPVSRGVNMAEKVKLLWPPEGTRVIVASHLTVPGVMQGEETTEMPRGREVSYPFAETSKALARIQGHYHRRQAFDPGDGGPPILIPGSLARLTFGEEDHTPSFMMLEF